MTGTDATTNADALLPGRSQVDTDRHPGPYEPFHGVAPGVHSEAGVLRSAIVDIRMRGSIAGDHAAESVAEALLERGVAVLGQRDLLADLLNGTAFRRVLVERVVAAAALSPSAARRVQRILLHVEPVIAARAILDGLPARDWDIERPASPRDRFLLPPLPRFRSLRSSSVLVGRLALPALPSSALPEARRAVTVTALLVRLHPALSSLQPVRYVHDPDLRRSAAQIDGDDVLLTADGALLVGIGHRTTAHGARQLARTLLEMGAVRRVVVVTLPRDARLERLDRLIGLMDVGLAVVHPAALSEDLATWTLELDEPDGDRLVAGAPRPFREVLGQVVGVDGVPPLVLPATPGSAGPTDYVPLEPGAVLSSAPEDDPATRVLAQAGLEVVPVPGAAGPVGGIRRLLMPVLRDPVHAA
jgi:arginine deiminase